MSCPTAACLVGLAQLAQARHPRSLGVEVLAKLRELILGLEAQLAELQAELLARVKDQVKPRVWAI